MFWPLLSFVSLPQTTYLVIDNRNLLIQQVLHWLLLVNVGLIEVRQITLATST